ncbi:AraC family transcriptional regulator ligand-binding domain-containing protein, partial [Oleiphilus sp. HI0066]|uniref:AraC family transcriptional regulator ligand-binding domain-containing protein n=2 Tax=unclassified Oleiphilus TaxID=2631174 RepID=UPI000AB41AC6
MDVRHSIIGLVEMLKWMESKGHGRSTLLDNTGIEESRLANPKETVSSKEELQFYRNLLSAAEDSNALLEAGFNLNLPSYGVWGLALISSSTFGKAIDLGIQFIDFTYTYNRIVLVEDNQYSGLRISQARDLGDLQMPMIERDISASFVLFRVLLQDESPVDEIRFSGPMTKPLS